MAYTQSDIDKLKKAIASGTLSVRSGDDSVTYRSLAEMERALRIMEAEVNPPPAASGGGMTVSYIRAGRGL